MLQAIQTYFEENPLVVLSTPIYVVLISLEVLLSNYQKRRYYTISETLINVWLNIANTLLGVSVKGVVLLLMASLYQYHFITLSHPIVYWGLLFLGVDLCFYVEHRCEHYSRILWAVHVTHHSSVEYNLTTGFRSSVFRPFVSIWFYLPLVLLGFKPLDILFMDALCQIYGIMVHTRYIKKMPSWFEWIWVSPGLHRVHHASNVTYLDKNMGMVLIIWDRLFGTFQKELEQEPCVYGLTKNPENPHHPIQIIFHEWKNLLRDTTRKGISWSDRIKYLIFPPGWSHDGSTQTSSEMRRGKA